MSIQALLFRFALILVGLSVVVGVTLTLLGVKSGSSGGTAALLGAVMWACQWFARKNARYFTRSEKRSVVLGMLAIDLVFQVLVGAAASAGRPGDVPFVAVLFGLVFVGVLHAAVIWFFVGLAGKEFAKQAANGG